MLVNNRDFASKFQQKIYFYKNFYILHLVEYMVIVNPF
ncbi:MAG: hypothetical protein PWQ94_972, partial [Thermoanaerobacterium sp.]|nr:hypothetical protein [Thermoanaerobacterium sp.]